MKKRAVTVMDQSRKSSDREQTALRQAQEALELKESATTSALRAARRECYMLDLVTDASQDMAGNPSFFLLIRLYFSYSFLCYIYFFVMLLTGSFLDSAAEEQRVNSRVEALCRLARSNDVDFWADKDRTC
jgi:hypothetical protein